MEIELLKKVIQLKTCIDKIAEGQTNEASLARKLLDEIISEKVLDKIYNE